MTLRIFDKYEVIRRLATGGMGDIFLARQVGVAGFSRLVVLKSLRGDIVERDDFFAQFLNEARTAATLNHPHVVAVYEVDEYRGVYFIAMEYIEGTDLSTLLRATVGAHQRIPFRVSAGMIHDAALGLHHAHTAKDGAGRPLGIVHRDVSPQNVMVRMDGITKVVDFGIAAATDRIDPFRGRLQGKVRYMSPEQLTGDRLSGASDQFSLGVVLWELLAHDRLFSGQDATTVLREIAADTIAPPSTRAPHVPPALDAIVLTMLARDPARRFPSLREAAAALRAFLDRAGGAVDQQIAKFVSVMVGPHVQARTRSLTPEPVVISGLLEAAETRCAACGAASSLRHRFCPECGAPLSAPAREVTVATRSKPRTSVPVAPPALASLRNLLREQADALDELFAGEVREVVVLAARIERVGGDARAVEPRVLRAVTAAIEPFDPAIVQMSASALVLVLDRGVADPLRALRLAAELERALGRLEDELLGVALRFMAVVEHGPIEVLGPGSSTFALRGPAIDRARDRALALDAPGIVLDAAVAARVAGRVEVDATLRFTGFRELGAVGERPRLVGRRDELMAGKQLLAEAARGTSGALVLEGEPGTGKTRLADELAAIAAKQGFITVVCRAARGDGWTGAELLGALLREGLRHLAIGDPAARPADRLALLDLAPEVAAQVSAYLRGAASGDVDEAILSAMVRLSQVQSACWVVDDVHLADVDARAALLRLRARIAGPDARIALLLTADGPLADLPGVHLGPLADEKLLAVAQGHLGGPPLPLPIAQLLLVRSAGNPGVAVAVLEALIALGGLVRDEAPGTPSLVPEAPRSWRIGPSLVDLALPHHLDGLIAAHLSALSRVAQAFLRAAAVLESPFVADLVLDVLRYGGDRGAIVEEVLASRLVRATGSALEIVQSSVEARLRRSVLEGDRKKLHQRTADLLGADPSPTPAVLAARAHHLRAAGDEAAAAHATARAAEAQPLHAAARALWAQCLELYARQAAHDRAAHLEPWLAAIARATPIVATHRLEEARALLDQAVPRPDDPPSLGRSEALAARSAVELTLGLLAEAEASARAALAALPPAAPEIARAPVVEALARVLEERGQLAEAVERMTEAARGYESAEDPAALWRPLNALGRLNLRLGRRDRAQALLLAAAEAALSSGSAAGRVATAINRAALAAPADALVLLEEAAQVAQEAGDALAGARIAYNTGSIALSLGRVAEGQAALDRALRVATEIGWREGVALAHHALASAHLTPSITRR